MESVSSSKAMVAEANMSLEKSVEVLRKLATENPSVHLYRNQLALTYNRLASFVASQGRLLEATENSRGEVEVRELLASKVPNHKNFGNSRLISAYVDLAGREIAIGNREVGRNAAQAALDLAESVGENLKCAKQK